MAKYTGAAQLASVARVEHLADYTKSRRIFQTDVEAAEIITEKKLRRIVQALIDLDIDSGELVAIRPDGAGTLELNKRIFELIEQKFGTKDSGAV